MTKTPSRPSVPADRDSRIFLKTSPDVELPDADGFYWVLAREGLLLCRNHPLFRSRVLARTGPSQLAPHGESLDLSRFPKVPQAALEQAVGFFSAVADLHGSEAAAFFVLDLSSREVSLLVPPQTAAVSESWGGYRYAHEVVYGFPTDLPAGKVVIGDIHSHVNEAAYASATDVADERSTDGVHLVVGRIGSEPPEVVGDFVVDGARFPVTLPEVTEGYERRDPRFPAEWLERLAVTVKRYQPAYGGWRS